MLDPKVKTDWCAALRSGEYNQSHGQLYQEDENGYCCLGVLAKVAGLPLSPDGTGVVDDSDTGNSYMPFQALGLSEIKVIKCYGWNDAQEKSFPKIADLIEADKGI